MHTKPTQISFPVWMQITIDGCPLPRIKWPSFLARLIDRRRQKKAAWKLAQKITDLGLWSVGASHAIHGGEFTFSEERVTLDLVRIPREGNESHQDVVSRGLAMGLELCPAEAALQARLQNPTELADVWFAMQPIRSWDRLIRSEERVVFHFGTERLFSGFGAELGPQQEPFLCASNPKTCYLGGDVVFVRHRHSSRCPHSMYANSDHRDGMRLFY